MGQMSDAQVFPWSQKEISQTRDRYPEVTEQIPPLVLD